MKIFQIINGLCYYDMTNLYETVEQAKYFYPPNVKIIEAPDNVFEGWGYDDENERFIQPTPPEGWLYDPIHGGFYQEGYEIPLTTEEKIQKLESDNAQKAAQIQLQSQQLTFLEDCILEMADEVYA